MPQELEPNIIMDIGARIRVLENKYNTVNEHMLMINQNMIHEYKEMMSETKAIDEEIKILKQDIFNIKETVKKMFKETEIFARKEDIKVLEKYINLWNPIKFITEEEVDKIIEEKLKERSEKIGRGKR